MSEAWASLIVRLYNTKQVTAMKKATHFLTAILISSFFVLGCDTTEKDWQEAQQLNTIEAYQSFRETHPASSYDSLTSVKIEELSWEKVIDDGALEAFQKFIEDFPQSEHVAEATRIGDELLWGGALEKGTLDAYVQYLTSFPDGRYADKIVVDVEPSWFSRFDANEEAALTIPDNARPTAYIRNYRMSGGSRTMNIGGRFTFVPDPSQGKILISGTLETSAGPIKKKAQFGAFQYIYYDSTRSRIVGWVSCVVSGEVILPMTSLSGGPRNRFVSNSFEADGFGEDWILIKLDPEKQQNLCVEEGGYGSENITQNYPGTVVTTGKGVFTRVQDGWHYAMRRQDN